MTTRGRGAPRRRPTKRTTTAGERRLVIAIDGPAGAGKSTAARALAAALGYTYVDSGAMYRLVALAAREHGVADDDTDGLARLVDALDFDLRRDARGMRVVLGGRDVTDAIREPAVTASASRVATVSAVRRRLVERQRELARGGGVVMDGRDVGTVVLPDADCKFFLSATSDERARRRQRDLAAAGVADTLEATRDEIDARDRRDRERHDSPLRPAADAVHVDTSALTPADVLARLLEHVRACARP